MVKIKRSLRKLGTKRFIGLMWYLHKSDIVTPERLEEERSLSKTLLLSRMNGLDDDWEGSARTAVHYFLADGYNRKNTLGKGL